jgi:hypothetical protein
MPAFLGYHVYKHRKLINEHINSVALVRERTISTERPLLVGEVSTNFCGLRVSPGQHNGSLRLYSQFLDPSSSFSFQVAPQMYSRG